MNKRLLAGLMAFCLAAGAANAAFAEDPPLSGPLHTEIATSETAAPAEPTPAPPAPAEEDPAEPHDAWADDMVLAEGLARYEEMVTVPVDRLLASWAGLRTFAPDRQPVLGRDPIEPDFVWCAGQGGYGFQSAPAASALLADMLVGRPSSFDDAITRSLSASRFI